MKSNFIRTVLAVLIAAPLATYGQINTPSPSPRGIITQEVGLGEVTIDYGRPGVKGRKIFGAGDDFLLPNGTIWRTGAGAPTQITFSEDVKINGTDVPAGEYSIFTHLGDADWKVALYKNLSLNGNNPGNYKEEEEQARFTVKAEKMDWNTETMTFTFGAVTNSTATIDFWWENMHFALNVEANTDSQVMEQIASTMENPYSAAANTFNQAANYYYNNDKDLDKALEWINKAIEHGPSMFRYELKSDIQAKMGDKKGALASLEKAHEQGKNSTGGTLNFYNNTFKGQLDRKIAALK